MTPRQKIWGIIPAAGIGARMNTAQPKQYLPLNGRRVLDHSLLAVCGSDAVNGVVVGIRAGDRWWAQRPFAHPKLRAVSEGGEQRAQTVLNALRHLRQDRIATEDDWALVHDAVRPCVAAADIERLIAAARAHGDGALLALPPADTLKRANRDGVIQATLARGYWRALTPQMFRCGALERALRLALQSGVVPRDESAAMEHAGARPLAVAGHPANLKITVPADLELAAYYLAGKSQ